MKTWVLAFVLFISVLLLLGAPVSTPNHATEVQYADEAPAPELPDEPINVTMLLGILVSWAAILMTEGRMNTRFTKLHQQLDKLERYVNTRDNLLALRIDELSAEDEDTATSERSIRDDTGAWKLQRRH
jgi:hypothetical protein